jgi:hypothetical protein
MVQAYCVDRKVGEDGKLVLDDLPFQPGEAVQIIILPAPQPPSENRHALRGTILKYIDPFKPIADDDWEANQ